LSVPKPISQGFREDDLLGVDDLSRESRLGTIRFQRFVGPVSMKSCSAIFLLLGRNMRPIALYTLSAYCEIIARNCMCATVIASE